MLRYITFILFFLTFISCEDQENPVPEAAVNKIIRNIEADPQYNILMNLYSGIVISGGYKNNGILLYRIKTEGAIDDFVAFDMTCTNEISTCKMKWNSTDPYYTKCECCNSRFNIIGNYIESGAAKYPLRRYNCYYENGDLHIYN